MFRRLSGSTLAFFLLCSATALYGQDGRRRFELPGAVPHDTSPPHFGVKGVTEPDEPSKLEPAAPTDYRDPKYKLSFKVPAGWNFEHRDGQLSNFLIDTHMNRRNLDMRGVEMRGVAAINYNPYPVSTFASANFYFSVVPKATPQSCAELASSGSVRPMHDAEIGGMTFRHGRDQHGSICTESRDEIFTALRGKSCVRFDLVVNTFCAQTSGAMEISPDQLEDVDTRLAGILGSVKFDEN